MSDFRTFDEIGTQGIALDITRHWIEVVVRLHRERFEATLIDVRFADSPRMLLPACDVCEVQSLKERGPVAVVLGRQHEMSLIGHPAVTTNPQELFDECRCQQFLERRVIGGLVEQSLPYHASIENVKQHPTRRDSTGSGDDCSRRNPLNPPTSIMDLPAFQARFRGAKDDNADSS